MNAIAIPTRFTGTRPPAGSPLAAGFVDVPRRAPADWLPAPPYARPSPAGSLSKNSKQSGNLWAQLQTQSALETVGFALLVAAAILGIGYGFSCLVNLVQHWALFNMGVGHLLA